MSDEYQDEEDDEIAERDHEADEIEPEEDEEPNERRRDPLRKP